MPASPTERTLFYLRRKGYLAEVVEKWIPQVRRRKDLFGFGDVLAIREGEVLLVQATSDSNTSSRVKKIAEAEAVDAVRKAGIRIEVHGWRRLPNGRWSPRIVDCS